MKLISPKNLGIIFVSLMLILISLYIKNSKSSTLIVTAKENKFFTNLSLNEKDKGNLSKIFTDLSIPKSVLSEFSFQLNPVSSVQLAFLSPINFNLETTSHEIKFTGKLSRVAFKDKDLKLQEINIPNQANLTIFASNLIDFITVRQSFPIEFSNWLNDNFSTNSGQYLTVFGENSQFSLITMNPDTDLNSLKSLVFEEVSPNIYKEETRDDTTFHLLRFPTIQNEENLVVLFTQDEWLVLSSSREAAQTISSSLKQKKESEKFPSQNLDINSNLVISYKNSTEYPIGKNFNQFLFFNPQVISNIDDSFLNTLDKIHTFEFSLKEADISGLINIK